jgi:hypothetical protein
MEILVEIIAYVVRPTSSASVCERQINNFFSAILCQFCDFGLRRKLLLEVSVTVPLVFTWEKNMHLVLSRGFLPLVIGATLLAGGCATKDDVRAAQAADAARMQALDARSAADMAFAAAQSAGQRADQANSTAQQAQQTANNAQSAADNAQASAQNAAATAQQAKDDVRAAEERTQQAERNRRVRNTRLARGERG